MTQGHRPCSQGLRIYQALCLQQARFSLFPFLHSNCLSLRKAINTALLAGFILPTYPPKLCTDKVNTCRACQPPRGSGPGDQVQVSLPLLLTAVCPPPHLPHAHFFPMGMPLGFTFGFLLCKNPNARVKS